MAFFGLSDISFNKGAVDRRGPLGALVSSPFEQTTLRYPIDVGNYDKGHYMVFYIRQQKKTQFGGKTLEDESVLDAPGGSSTKAINLSIPGTNLGGELLSKINSGLGALNSATGGALSGVTGAASAAASNIVGGINNLFGQKASSLAGDGAETTAIIDTSIKKITGGGFKFLRTTKLTTDAIAMYMPDTLNFTYAQGYDQMSLAGDKLGKAMAAGASVLDAARQSGSLDSFDGIVKAADAAQASAKESLKLEAGAALAGAAGGAGQAVFTAVTGKVVNPMLEMIYKSPNFRTFQFEFTFYPRDEVEALEVQRIIERFRFHQAPEIVKEAQGFLIPPSEFEIKFYYGGRQNPNIPQITTCILTNIDTNYAPNGWSAYEVPNENEPRIGRTGMPTSISLSLQFQEISYLTKEDFKRDTVNQKTLAR